MSRTLTLEVPEQVYEAVSRVAQQSGLSVIEWITADLCRRLNGDISSAEEGVPQSRSGEPTAAHRQPKPRPVLTEAEWEAARQRLLRFAGAVNSDDPRSADNDRIDADLAREYASPHEEEG